MQQKSNFKLLLSQLKSQKPLNKWLLLDFQGRPGKSATKEVPCLKMTVLVLPEIEFIFFLADGTRLCFGFSVRIMLITLKKKALKNLLFWLVLSSAHASQGLQCPILCSKQVHKKLQGSVVGPTDPN